MIIQIQFCLFLKLFFFPSIKKKGKREKKRKHCTQIISYVIIRIFLIVNSLNGWIHNYMKKHQNSFYNDKNLYMKERNIWICKLTTGKNISLNNSNYNYSNEHIHAWIGNCFVRSFFDILFLSFRSMFRILLLLFSAIVLLIILQLFLIWTPLNLLLLEFQTVFINTLCPPLSVLPF